MTPLAPGAELLVGAVDGHVHACPHINARSLDVFDAVREAAAAGMAAVGLMDNFANSSGLAALAMRQLGELGVEVFGGLIMEPPAGGVSADAVSIALDYGYGPGTGARFVSFPTHHTRHVARQEGRGPLHVEACYAVPEAGPLPDPVPEILDLVARADVALNTGHLSAPETLRLVEAARAAGIGRILAPASLFDAGEALALAGAGATLEFSYFFVSPATQIGLTHVDGEAHRIPATTVPDIADTIRAVGAARCIVSGDCGVGVLPRPVEGLRSFLMLLAAAGVPEGDLRLMVQDNPAAFFRIGRR